MNNRAQWRHRNFFSTVELHLKATQGLSHIAKRLPAILDDGENELPGVFRQLLQRLVDRLKALDDQLKELETQIQIWHQENEASRKLAGIPGIGPITASALVASVGDATNFNNGRQLAAWLGLVPRQHSTDRHLIGELRVVPG